MEQAPYPAALARALADFTEGFTDAAIWSSADSDGRNLDEAEGIEPNTLFRLAEIADAFFSANEETLDAASEFRNYTCLGHDFWLTAAGHGAGFWDREEIPEPLRDRLTEAAHAYPQCEHCAAFIDDEGFAVLEGL